MVTSDDGLALAQRTRAGIARDITGFLHKYSEVFIVLLLVAIGAALLWTATVVIRVMFDARVQVVLTGVRHGPGTRSATMPNPDGIAAVAGTPIVARLDNQLADIQAAAGYHLRLATEFFRLNYTALTIATTAAVIAGLIAVFISWGGWKEANIGIKIVFAAFTGTAVLFTAYGKVYKQTENFGANAALYYSYLQLEDELLSYYPRLVGGDSSVLSPAVMVREIDARVATLRSFAIELDASSVPTTSLVAEQLTVPVSTNAQR